ncbi:hypothetical protein DWQ65_04735 [Treponema phagedenis]|uniref:Uncharacterized protein n=1 Tax=Treponema phagedenis TaxID=162 RepID=A0AAE6ITM4_TREPH|nr:hypothetical protein FUT79_06125 [Treponema phagedenis]QEJ98013.1 hypothetical protein FUT82_08395 [Treponema phagedenis]QEK00731.1 hypothetical protein FUT84_05810 [Treponema phagedenis]QEK03520.1 hypothetical protein FUT83_06690 [Treponema phagedenis]QEK05738.1 hypothetical protein FUT80_02725 [Treponema phagedenis]
MAKTKPRVLKLYKYFCFKTSFLLRTTAIRGGSEFCSPWQNYTYEFENSCLYSCGSFQTQFCVEPRASMPVLSFDVRVKN